MEGTDKKTHADKRFFCDKARRVSINFFPRIIIIIIIILPLFVNCNYIVMSLLLFC
jgi:hypothetical protein